LASIFQGGIKTRNYKFIGGDVAAEVGWFKDNTRYATKPIGEKKPNELGLYDMAGNVYEYCLDGTLQIRNVRGGGWSSQMQSMRSSYKNGSRCVSSSLIFCIHMDVGFFFLISCSILVLMRSIHTLDSASRAPMLERLH
jgi:hypothetical protein